MRTESESLSPATRLLVRRLDELGRVTDEPGRLTRTFLSPAMERANQLVGSWMAGAGMSVREDDTGNLIGRLASPNPRAKTLLLGSHLDTVRNAGRFDGALGVVLPILALGELRQRGIKLPFSVEVLGFSEEEAVRFAGAYIGSKAYTGTLLASDLELCDARGSTLRQVIEAHAGRKFLRPRRAHPTRDLIGYVEVHIEQGPVLEAKNQAVGIVSAIASQTRGRITFRGKAGHAGTTPMDLRRDALAGAAEFILAVERHAASRMPLVATVGTAQIPAGAANVIPGETVISLDVRHPNDAKCARAVDALVQEALLIARRRRLECIWQQTMQHAATPCAAELNAALTRSVRTVQGECPVLISGAGHDAVVVARLAPVAMLFVRCRDGLSHHPDEFAAPADLEVALRVLTDFIARLAAPATSKPGAR